MALNSSFTRPTDDRMVAGVCSGIARRFGLDVGLVRAVMFIAIAFAGVSVWVYPLLWLVMPEEGQDRAGINDVVDQARKFADDAKARREAGTTANQQPMDVFDPYAEDERH